MTMFQAGVCDAVERVIGDAVKHGVEIAGRRAHAAHDALRWAHSNHAVRRYGVIRARSASIFCRRCRRSWSAWRPSHNPSETPKYRASRKSVSAVIDRLPSTSSLIRRSGTPIARARPFCVRPIGSMNSSSRTSPGVGLGIWLVAVDDFDTVGTFCRPDEADAPLPIDADAMLPCPAAFLSLQLITRRHDEIQQRRSMHLRSTS
jgi:hypothetical protein